MCSPAWCFQLGWTCTHVLIYFLLSSINSINAGGGWLGGRVLNSVLQQSSATPVRCFNLSSYPQQLQGENYSHSQHLPVGSCRHSSSTVVGSTISLPSLKQADAQHVRPYSLTSVPMSFILASASSLRLPCSTPELTSGMGMSLMGGRYKK